MAPDLNAVAAGAKWDYDAPGSTGYNIPDVTLGDPAQRKMRVLTIGAGVSGILTAYQLQKYCQNVELKIFEKNDDIGGTWLLNRYPGCACDIPSHAYQLNFALNPDWPRYFAYSPDIHKYLQKVVETFGLRKYMTFNSEVVGCYWEQDKGQWRVKIKESADGMETRLYEETCDLLLEASGILNNFKWPDIPGLDKFKGKVCHTARWPTDYQEDQWKDDRIAIIGSGASSIQTVQNMQQHAKHLDIFVRTGIWFVEIAANYGINKPYTPEEIEHLHRDPDNLTAISKSIEDQVNALGGVFFAGSEAQIGAQKLFGDRMAEFIRDPRLLKGFTPKFGVGCRRITPGDAYMNAIQEPNVDVHFTPVDAVTEDGVMGGDGEIRKVDTIVCATGFDVSYKPRFPIVGINGVDLAEKWKHVPESYMGVGVPGFPNMLLFIGPTWPVENGSVMGPLGTVSEYVVQIVKKMQTENIRSLVPKQDVTDAFNEHVQEWIKHTVWKDDCRSWYRNNDTGRVNAIWPGSSLHYQRMINTPRYEDFDITYHNTRNQWAFMGMGWTIEHRPAGLEAGLDKSPYINTRYIDPKWLEACGYDKQAALDAVLKATADAAVAAKKLELELEARGEGGSIVKSQQGRVL